jgi:hypothetical protein
MTMRKRKWFIPVVVVSVLLIGSIVGGAIVTAQEDSAGNTEAESEMIEQHQALLERVCAIYEENTGVAIDSEQLKDALKQARSEIQNEALESRLQNLVDEGMITQEEADNYFEWWQSRPDVELLLPGFGGPRPGGGIMQGECFQFRGDLCPVPDAPAEESSL